MIATARHGADNLRTLSRWDRLLIETAALHCGYIDRYPVMAPLGRLLRLPDKEHAASADVHGRDMVRLTMASALATLEFVPRRAVLLGRVSASRTRLRGVRRIDVNHSNSGQPCFVFYKLAELGEAPAKSSRAIAFSISRRPANTNDQRERVRSRVGRLVRHASCR